MCVRLTLLARPGRGGCVAEVAWWTSSGAGGRGDRGSSAGPAAGWGGSPGLCTIASPFRYSATPVAHREIK